MTTLKLVAFDQEDLTVLSAHLQDAVVRVADLVFLPKERRFVALLNRFDWARAEGLDNGPAGKNASSYRRLRSALRFEYVNSARVQGLPLDNKQQVLALLAIECEPAHAPMPAPAGVPAEALDPAAIITLHFAGGGAVRLEAECIEAELRDLGPTWRARTKPDHSEPQK